MSNEQRSAILRDLAYFGRFGWVVAKETFGLPRIGDRTFYVDRFVRAMRAATLPRTYGIMATGKNDGAGSQAQAAMSAICFAEALGLEYIHRPMTSMLYELQTPTDEAAACTVVERHTGGYVGARVSTESIQQWEDYFNLGSGARQISDCTGPVVPLDQLLMAPHTWPDNAIIEAPHYLHFCNQEPDAWEHVVPAMRAKHRAGRPRVENDTFTVALHMRRGTIRPDNRKFARNYTGDAVFMNTLGRVIELVSTRVSRPRIQLFSQGSEEQFADFAQYGCELHIDEPALDTHAQLVAADVLILSKSAFSYTAGLLHEGLTLYDPHKYGPLPSWVTRAPDGSFGEKQFLDQLDALLARKRL